MPVRVGHRRIAGSCRQCSPQAVNLEETSANVSMGDLNGDGFPDIATARSGAPNVVFFSVK